MTFADAGETLKWPPDLDPGIRRTFLCGSDNGDDGFTFLSLHPPSPSSPQVLPTFTMITEVTFNATMHLCSVQ